MQTFLEKSLATAGVVLNGTGPTDVRVHDKRLYRGLLVNPALAAGEAYMAKWWDCDQLDDLFYRICQKRVYGTFYGKGAVLLRTLLNKAFNLQTRMRSKEVAERHYNLGNDLYSYMLGESMAYTCGYWKNAKTLDEAQRAKFDLVCRKIDIRPGDRVLELGCGWGSFAKYAAENYGCTVVAVNISEEQVRYARESTKGLPVHVHLCDYRDQESYNPEKKLFDKAVSIGLCEHIGHKNYNTFLNVVRDQLKEDGLFLLHTIGRNDSAAFTDPWIHKYIFPNGILPSVKNLGEAMENVFVMEDFHNIGADYDKTLMAWHKNFNDNWSALKGRYDETFFRLWNYYLLSCAGGFRARSMQLWQMVLSPHGVPGGYESLR